MKLKGAEKQFWWNFGHIKDSKNTPKEISDISSVDSSDGDEIFELLIDKVKLFILFTLKKHKLPMKA